MTIILNSPFFDPTIPPHSAAYLSGALRSSGNGGVSFIDVNCELHNHICSKAFFDKHVKSIERVIEGLEKKDGLSRIQRMQYRVALQCRPIEWRHVDKALKTLKSDDDFYDYSKYQGAAVLLDRYFSSLNIDAAPGLFSVGKLNIETYGSASSVEDFSNPEFLSLFHAPFASYFDLLVERISHSNSMVLGVSCNYTDQLPFTIYIANRMSQEFSDRSIVVGGTEITDLYKNALRREDIWQMFHPGVTTVVGEGESAFSSIVEAAKNLSSGVPKMEQIHTNIVTASNPNKVRAALSENINEIGNPDYSIYDMQSYWSPSPVVMYSPTRGCYWNKCTFCDYGLNFDSPTSPSRQRSRGNLIQDLQALSSVTEHVYLAVDAISPSYLRRFSEAVGLVGANLRWSAEVRLDRSSSADDYAQVLRSGGCVALSFGFESGSQRILELIDKGVDLAKAKLLLSELALNGIHTQLMGFTGFPTETVDDRNETKDFLETNSAIWSLAGIGSFAMTPGAIVAKRYYDFGVSCVSKNSKDTIVRELDWVCEEAMEEGSVEKEGQLQSSSHWRPPLQRPFAGGIDTAHSILYFSRFKGVDRIKSVFSLVPDHIVEERTYDSCFGEVLEFEDPSDMRQIMRHPDNDIEPSDNFLTKGKWLRGDRRLVGNPHKEITIVKSGNIYQATSQLQLGPFKEILEDAFV